MKGVFVILDGIADEPNRVLNGKTPLEAAKTPNLDAIARKSRIDYCYSVSEGYAPESDNAIISLLGYDIDFEERGSLEALGMGIKLMRGDLAFRTNFGTIDNLENRKVIDRRAGRTLTTKEAQDLAKEINKKVKLGFKFEFYNGIGHRGVLVIRGGFSNNISNVDRGKDEKLEFARALDDEEDSQIAAENVNSFVRQSYEVLKEHWVNKGRIKRGLYPGNVILCRGAANEPAKFNKLKGKWMALAYMPLEIGIARATGMEVYDFSYPKLKGNDVYENLYSGLKKAIKRAVRMLKKNREKVDYFFIHFKETDVPGHDNKPLDKMKMIEILDQRFFSFLKKFIGDAKLIVTGDHATPCARKAHSADPVPVLTYPNGKEEEKRFSEREGMKGKKILAKNLLERGLF